MKYSQNQIKSVLKEISKRTKELLNSEELMGDMSFDERINESILLTGYEQDIKFLLIEPWQALEKEIIYIETLLKKDPYVDLELQLKELKKQRSKRSELEEEGISALENYQKYKIRKK